MLLERNCSPEQSAPLTNLIAATQPLSRLDPDSYFIYGSTALSIRKGNVFNRVKKRFDGVDPLRDIDIALFENGPPWSDIRYLSQEVYENSQGTFCLDPHLIQSDQTNTDNVLIKDVSIPSRWLTKTPQPFHTFHVSLLDQTSSLMLRMLHADPRVRDTRRIIEELSAVENWRDERLKFGAQYLLKSPHFYKKAPSAIIKLLLGAFPEESQEKLRVMFRNKIADVHLGSDVIRQNPEYL